MGHPILGPGAWAYDKAQLDAAVAVGASLIAAPAAGKCIYLERITVTLDAAGTIKVTEGADAAATRLVNMFAPANGGIDLDFRDRPYPLPAATALLVTTTGTNMKAVAYYVVGDV